MSDFAIVELWRPIESFEDLYEISNLGRVRRVGRRSYHGRGHGLLHTPKMLRPRIKSNGYLFVGLSGLVTLTYHHIHSLVARAFIGPRPDNQEVNHRDGNKCNNQYNNLEYVPHDKNIEHAVANHLFSSGEDRWNAKLTTKKARSIRSLFRSRKCSQNCLSREFGVSRKTIQNVLAGKTWRLS